MPLTLLTPPTVEPITLTQAKLHCRVEEDRDDEDELLTELIAAAREHAEAIAHCAFLQQTWRLTLDAFPCGDVIELPMPPLLAVTTFTYVNAAGVVTPFTEYALDAGAYPGRVVRSPNTVWPSSRAQRNAVVIEFTAGYGTEPADVPAGIRAAIRLLVANWYTNREAFVESRFALETPFSVNALLAPHTRLAAGMA